MRMHPAVIVHSDDPDPVLAVIGETHPDLTVHACRRHEDLAGLIAASDEAVVYSVRFQSAVPFPRQVLTESTAVRWVSVGGSGTDHLRPWDPSRLTVTNAAGVAADMMAEYVLGTLLSFSLDLPGFARKQRAGQWALDGRVTPIEGKTVLILGLGKTGTAVARRCKAMGMMTLGVRARPQAMAHVDEVHGMDALPALWPRADVVVCCVPLVDSTKGLVDAGAFAALRSTAILIDVSRGGVVDEEALLAALDQGRLRGVARDVFDTEPLPADHPLWAYDNVIITPHCSSVYEGWETNAAHLFAENLTHYRNSEPLANVVDPARGY